MVALDRLEPGTWAVVFKDTTSLKPELVVLSEEVLDRGIGEVGSINIPPFILPAVVPEEFSAIASRHLQGIRPISGAGLARKNGSFKEATRGGVAETNGPTPHSHGEQISEKARSSTIGSVKDDILALC